MKVLVTGAAGFVGSHLAERLAARGDAVVGVDNFNDYYDPARKRRTAKAVMDAGVTLLEHDLIDEYRLWVFPVVVGAGKRFFGDGTSPGAMKLVDSKITSTGVTISTYERAGDIEIGEMDFEEPTEAELERRKRLVDA